MLRSLTSCKELVQEPSTIWETDRIKWGKGDVG